MNKRPIMNKQKTNSIEWCSYTWSPVTGCLHSCPYCYARDKANRFRVVSEREDRAGDLFEPRFWPDRLEAPFNTKVPRLSYERDYIRDKSVFVCSMADLFGCYDDQTEVLTSAGWKLFGDVSDMDDVGYLEPITGELRYSKPLSITHYHYKGKMYRVRTRLVDLLVTPNHKLYISQRPTTVGRRKEVRHEGFSLQQAKDIFGRPVFYKRDFVWVGHEVEHLMGMPAELWLEFFGFWLAEGNATKSCGKSWVQIAAPTKKRVYTRDIIDPVAKKIGCNIFESQNDRFRIYGDNHVFKYLRQFGHAHQKYIPQEIKELSTHLLSYLLKGLIAGDGQILHKGRFSCAYFTVSKRLADDVQEIALKCGYVATVVVNDRTGMQRVINGHLATSNFPCYEVIISDRCHEPEVNLSLIKARGRRANRDIQCIEEWQDYDGEVFCLEVPSHILYVRRNGRAIWCGNSWVPQEWIDMVMHVVGMAKQWNFIFLTKNPERLLTIEWPRNAWVGATADTQERAERALGVFLQMWKAETEEKKAPEKIFLSCAPLLEGIDFEAIPALRTYALSDLIDWIIVGGQSRTSAVPALQPEWEWVEKILVDGHQEGLPVYFKPNLLVRPREYPR